MVSARRATVGRAIAILALMIAPLALLASAAPAARASRCGPAALRASFTLVPGSQGAGQIGYTLTITNAGRTSCTISGFPGMRLIGAGGVRLATRAHPEQSGGAVVALATGQWAQSNATFSPDIAAANEPGNHCEPLAYRLLLTLAGGGSVLAPMDPTMVCQHGSMAFSALRAQPRRAPCRASALAGSFRQLGAPYSGQVTYALLLENDRSAPCAIWGTPRLQLERSGSRTAPTSVESPVAYPYVVAAHQTATLDATAYAKAGPGEPARGNCEPPASLLGVILPNGGGRLTLALSPARAFCRRGALAVSGLFLNG